jgi:hypothetical protein
MSALEIRICSHKSNLKELYGAEKIRSPTLKESLGEKHYVRHVMASKGGP